MLNRRYKNYWETHIENLPVELEPLLTAMLFKQGCSGTAQKLDFTQNNLVYGPIQENRPFIHVVAYFEINKKESVAALLQEWVWENCPETSVQWVLQRERDYLKEWKKYFKPFKLSKLSFVPSWLYTSKKYKLSTSVILEPGMAFGTGHHSTTRFAILALKKLEGKLKKSEILDVGAGSGILSVVAERLGAKSVLAIDNDPECWRETRKTFKLNKTKKCKVATKQINDIKKSYDVTVANIIDGILVDLKSDLWRVTRPGGYLILSGILNEGADEFLKKFCLGHTCKVLTEFRDQEWASYILQKK